MTRRQIIAATMLWLAAGLAWPHTVHAGVYEDTVMKAEQLWTDGRRAEAVKLYGRVWELNAGDVERQILYAERSAEVGNYRWALNFYRVVEQKAKDDPYRLYRVYQGYAKTYRMAGRADLARQYEGKAAALRDSGKVKEVAPEPSISVPEAPPTPKPMPAPVETPRTIIVTPPSATTPTAAAVTPAPSLAKRDAVPPSVKVLKRARGFLKKRIAVAPVSVGAAVVGVAGYGNELREALIAELRNSNRFVVVEPGTLGALALDLKPAASGLPARGSASKPSSLAAAQLLVKVQITRFDDPGLRARITGAGSANAAGSTGTLRMAIELRLYNVETGALIASDAIAAERAPNSGEPRINPGDFRFDDPQSQTSALGYVTREIIQKALEKIVADSARVAWAARIIKREGDDVYFNAGSDAGIGAAQHFRVMSVGETPAVSAAGTAPAAAGKPVGEIEVTRVEATLSVGRVLNKKGDIKILDKVMEE